MNDQTERFAIVPIEGKAAAESIVIGPMSEVMKYISQSTQGSRKKSALPKPNWTLKKLNASSMRLVLALRRCWQTVSYALARGSMRLKLGKPNVRTSFNERRRRPKLRVSRRN